VYITTSCCCLSAWNISDPEINIAWFKGMGVDNHY